MSLLKDILVKKFIAMPDYDHYVDFEAIKRGDKAFARGQFFISEILYQKALDRLLQYPGDRMFPMHLGEDLREKLEISRNRK